MLLACPFEDVATQRVNFHSFFTSMLCAKRLLKKMEVEEYRHPDLLDTGAAMGGSCAERGHAGLLNERAILWRALLGEKRRICV